jgi:voltage-gated potassium channel
MTARSADPETKLKFVGSFLALIFIGGAVGYMLLCDASFLDALYMTVITVTTVGYREVFPLDQWGKIFTMVILIVGVGTLFYAAGLVVQMFLEGQIGTLFNRRKMERRMQKMKDHYIIAGYGRVGQTVTAELKKNGKELIIIEAEAASSEILSARQERFVIGDATQDEILERAQIGNARALISTLAEEAQNVYLTLSARQLNPKLTIVARADSEEAQKKIMRAGANRVIRPHELGGLRMAMAILRPNVVDFMPIESSGASLGLSIEEIVVKPGCKIDGVELRDSDIKAELNLMVVGIKRANGEVVISPDASFRIAGGDTLIVMGKNDNLSKLDVYAGQ